MKENNKFEGLDNIEDYLESRGNNVPVEVPELGTIIDIVSSKTNLNKEEAEQIVKLYFQEIRNIMLSGKIAYIPNFGTFFISSPKTTKNKTRVFAKFNPSKVIVERLNAKI